MRSTPLFSIVLPTRNRARLLEESAVPSIIRQTFGDFEIVICDNASTDDTPTTVASLARNYPGLIRYFRTEKWIPKEEFFQWSMEMARGEYITLFFDDDIFCAKALEKMHRAIEVTKSDVVSYSRSLVYFYPDYPIDSQKNLLMIPPFSGQLYAYDSMKHLEDVYKGNAIYLPTPMVSNAFYKKSLVENMISRHRKIYLHGHMGDYDIAVLTLVNTRNFFYLDDPIVLFGHWSQNTSAQLHDFKPTAPEYIEWIDSISSEYLSKMPWPHYLWPNCVAAALNDMAKRVGIDLEVPLVPYFRSLHDEIMRLSQNADLRDKMLGLEKDLFRQARRLIGKSAKELIAGHSDIPSWRSSPMGWMRDFENSPPRGIDTSRGWAFNDPKYFTSIATALNFYEGLIAA